MDLDNFGECVKKMGWTRYSPNIITGTLTKEIEDFNWKYNGYPLWGYNSKEGTEEAILFTPSTIEEILPWCKYIVDLITKLSERKNLGTGLSIGMAFGKIIELKPITNNRTKTIRSDPIRNLAYLALRKAKKSGGSCIVIF
ncbi:MAG: hypothetical protein OEZ01_06180 [Candidatus Heimdallarchaeota archaeon]|nr:hypothetical protein [Candidatus Heimdallarchaeota archaeon]MDH5645575.1 hypothetical protein [Candidatus Heimdallarchaeota archaeon]